MIRVTDYDAISTEVYEQRYERYDHRGYERVLSAFVEGAAAVLEVGSGTGHWLKLLADRVPRLAGTDLSVNMLRAAQRLVPQIPLVRGRAESLPWQDGSFDRVFCVNAFHHFVDKPRFLAEVCSVLRPEGGLMTIAMDPHRATDRWWLYDYFPEAVVVDRERYLPSEQIREEMQRAGLQRCATVEAQHHGGTLTARAAFSRGLLDKGFTSQLAVMSEQEYQAGLARLRAAEQAAAARGEELLLPADFGLYATTGWKTVGPVAA